MDCDRDLVDASSCDRQRTLLEDLEEPIDAIDDVVFIRVVFRFSSIIVVRTVVTIALAVPTKFR